jgi:hypothetical protein
MKEEKEYFKKALRNLRVARKCLERVIKEKDEEHRASIMFQFCKQMAGFYDYLALTENDYRKRDRLFKFSSQFDNFAKFWRVSKE